MILVSRNDVGMMCFNRYMVECEYIKRHKLYEWFERFNRYMVECEFYLTGCPFLLRIRFNRYMVECELFDCNEKCSYKTVLIDTWWNVNFSTSFKVSL